MKVYIVVVTYCEDAYNDGVYADQDAATARVAQIRAAVEELYARQGVYIDRDQNRVTDCTAYNVATTEVCESYASELGAVAARLTEILGLDVEERELL